MLLNSLDDIMTKCTKCGADITATGYEAEELKLPNDVTGYLVSCKQTNGREEYDIYINTHPDLFPFYQSDFCKNNAIAYSHFPMTRQYIESKNIEY
jgi:hypothetical protein